MAGVVGRGRSGCRTETMGRQRPSAVFLQATLTWKSACEVEECVNLLTTAVTISVELLV